MIPNNMSLIIFNLWEHIDLLKLHDIVMFSRFVHLRSSFIIDVSFPSDMLDIVEGKNSPPEVSTISLRLLLHVGSKVLQECQVFRLRDFRKVKKRKTKKSQEGQLFVYETLLTFMTKRPPEVSTILV